MSAPSWPDAAPLRAIHEQADEAARAARLEVLREAGAWELERALQREQLEVTLERLTDTAAAALAQAEQCARDLGLNYRADIIHNAEASIVGARGMR